MESTENLREKIIGVFGLGRDSEKQKAVFDTEGPLLIIAGPGAGKTYTLVLRALYIIASGRAKPEEIVLTTFSQKSAGELRDRLALFARRLGLISDVSPLIAGTIHSVCNRFITDFIDDCPLRPGYAVLDDLSRPLFLKEYFAEIIAPTRQDGDYFGKWKQPEDAITRVLPFFDKITEELIEPAALVKNSAPFVCALGGAYIRYRGLLFKKNYADFAFLQRVFYDLLQKPETREKITARVKYALIDEYQDTNYVQEQIALCLAAGHNNLTAVGDEDQAIYRFRGATVRNILNFKKHFSRCAEAHLRENYRSHKDIIALYNRFMADIDWQGGETENENAARFPEKGVVPAPATASPAYPAACAMRSDTPEETAAQFADMAEYLLRNLIVDDPSDIALLLKSVKLEYSAPFIDALERRKIRSFCPRARAYFETGEVHILLAALALILGFTGKELDTWQHKDKIKSGLAALYAHKASPLIPLIKETHDRLARPGSTQDITLSSLPEKLSAFPPLSNFAAHRNTAPNIARFASLLSSFETFYQLPAVTARNRTVTRHRLFNDFFALLITRGLDEYEDAAEPTPKGYLPIMTIHQSKGLEFPVVAVGSLSSIYRVQKSPDKYLAPFYRRPSSETDEQIKLFDHARLFYVAFSRPRKFLALALSGKPQNLFLPTLASLPPWPALEKPALAGMRARA